MNSKRINPGAWATRLNELYFAGCHNCYQPGNAEGHSVYRSVVRSIPALELDVRKCGNDWVVGHDGCDDNDRFYRNLDDYFTEIYRTLVNDKFQFPIIVNLDFKNNGLDGQGGDGEEMHNKIKNRFGSHVFTKNDLAAYNGLATDTDFANPSWEDFRRTAAEKTDFWPKTSEDVIKNKVIFVANHLVVTELEDVREFNTLFLAPQFIADYQVAGQILWFNADGQVVFGNLSQNDHKCEGDLPRLLSSARIISRCWDGTNPDSWFIEKQWDEQVAIGTHHNVESEPLQYKIRGTPDKDFCSSVDSCNPGTFRNKRWTCLENHNIATGGHCPTSWVECKVGANPGIFENDHWVCPSEHSLQVGNSCSSKWVTFDDWKWHCQL